MKLRYSGTFEKWDLIRHKESGDFRWLHEGGMARAVGSAIMQEVNLDEFEYAFMKGDVFEFENQLFEVKEDRSTIFGFPQGFREGVEKLKQYTLVQRKTCNQ